MARTIIHSVTLFDGLSLRSCCSVVFDCVSGLIERVSDTPIDSCELTGDETWVDGAGCTLMPGFIDAHVHVHSLHLPVGTDNSEFLRSSLKCGITTVCDMHCDHNTVSMFRKQIQEELNDARSAGSEGRVTQSDLKSSLLGAMIEGGWPKPIVLGHNPSNSLKTEVASWPSVTEEGAVAFVSSHKAKGADYIKLMQEDCCSMSWETGSIPCASLELQASLTDAAHSLGLIAVAHALSLENTSTVLKAGVDGLTHTFFDQHPTEDVIRLHKTADVFVVPTLSIISSLTDEEHEIRREFAAIAEKKGLCDESSRSLLLQTVSASAPESKLEYAYETVRALHAAGVDIVAGTDTVSGLKGMAMGPSFWMELEMYVRRCGMTALEALRSATGVSAERFGFTDRGTVQAGKRADLLLVKGDPSRKLSCLWDGPGIIDVWKQGIRAMR